MRSFDGNFCKSSLTFLPLTFQIFLYILQINLVIFAIMLFAIMLKKVRKMSFFANFLTKVWFAHYLLNRT